MAGRGFLKSRLAQLAPDKETEEPQQKPADESSNAEIKQIPKVPEVISQTLLTGQQHVARGRRVINFIFYVLLR